MSQTAETRALTLGPIRTRPLVVIADPISRSGVERLSESFDVDEGDSARHADLAARCANAEALIVRSATQVTAGLIAACPELRVIGRAGVGLDNIDIAAAARAGITVVNTPDANTVSAAEHTMALLLAVARHLPQAHQSLHEGRWDRGAFVGVELAGRTLAVLGLGRVGHLVAERANVFGMRIIGYDPYLTESADLAPWIRRAPTVDDAVGGADFVTVHMPLTTETRGLIDERSISLMPAGVRIINTARGGIVDEDALFAALEVGQVAGAGLDVFAEEPATANRLLTHPRVVATPHLGASTVDAQDRAGIQVAEAVIGVLEQALQSIA